MISLHDYLTRGSDCALLYLNMLTGFFFKTLKLEVIHAHLLLSALAISDNSVIQVMQPTLVFTKQWNTHIGKWTCDILTCNFLAFIFEAYNDDLLIACRCCLFNPTWAECSDEFSNKNMMSDARAITIFNLSQFLFNCMSIGFREKDET